MFGVAVLDHGRYASQPVFDGRKAAILSCHGCTKDILQKRRRLYRGFQVVSFDNPLRRHRQFSYLHHGCILGDFILLLALYYLLH